ncbi:MAG TPA: hypothetical protein VF622_16210 [Segetibacter sp.]|jgi:hypothetical protein
MKKIIIAFCLLVVGSASIAQETLEDTTEQRGFRRDNIFIGGSIGFGLGTGTFNVGANPEVGYSIANWLDAGISTNINYFSLRAQYNSGLRQRSTTYGGGVFTRIYPLRGFFIQAQPEYNWIKTTLKDMSFSGGQEYKFNEEAPSLLVGVGYGRRAIGASNFFTAIMIDLGNNRSSPYIDADGAKLPIIRSGFNVYLRPKSQR